jgi:type I restriction enzyme S subunit
MEDLCELVTDGTHDSPKLQKDGVPFIKGRNIAGGAIDFTTCDFITQEDHEVACKRVKPRRGDILFSNIGSVGDTAVVRDDREFSIKNVALFRPDKSRIDDCYLYYLVLSPGFRSNVMNVRSGSAQPFISLANLRSFEINYEPSISTQRRIASILSAYDNLIENSQRRIQILEQMARALYREWFVKFRYPGHESVPLVSSPLREIPQGWETIPFARLLASMTGGDWGSEQREGRETEEVVVVRGTDFDEVAYGGQIRAPVRYIKRSSLVSRALKVGDVIIENSINAKSRSVGTTLLVDEYVLNRLGQDAIAASFCKVLRPHDQRLAPLIHLHARHLREYGRMEYYQNVATNGIANFQAQKFAKEEHLVLPADDGERSRLVAPIAAVFNNVASLASCLANLRRTRDLLLPRLISGQIDLDAA